MMEWPEELLEIFEADEFVNIHPTQPKATADDRMKEAFNKINEWYRENQREPSKEGMREERTYANQLRGFREMEWKRELLRPMDVYNLLDEAI